MATSSLSLSTTTSSSLGTTHMNNTVGGLDVDALVSATIQAASLPLVNLQNKNAKLQAQLNDYNTIKTALGTLQYAATDLTYSSTFSAMKATSSDVKVVTASSQNGGTSGSYLINVGATATITSNTSATIGNAASKASVKGTQVYAAGTALTDGTFSINGKTITVVAASDTRDTIIAKINAASAGVTASVGADGKVSITQNTAGASPTITLGADTSGFLANAGITQLGVTAGKDDTGSAGKKATITGIAQDLTTYNTALNKSGTFSINGKSISVTTTDTVNTIINKITASGAGVTASVGSDGTVTITQNTAGATPTITISDSSNLLAATGLTGKAVVPGKNSDETRTLDDLFGTAAGATSGYFSINGTFFSVDSTTDTLDSIVNKINTSATVGATAFYNSNTGTISLTSQTAGAKDITLGSYGGGGTDSSPFLSKIGLVQGNQNTGTEASVTVNGVAVTPVNNKVTFNGNTFTLVGAGTATVSVQSDVDSIVTKVQTFITAYNAAMDAINNKMNEKSDSSSTDASVGDLFCDPTLESLNQNLRNMTSSIVSSQPSSMQQLSQAGITTGTAGVFDLAQVQSGHLVLDTTKLTAALQSNPQAVTSLFGNSMVAVTGETVAGAGTTYNLKYGSISGTPTIQVADGLNNTYTLVSGTPKKWMAVVTDPTTQSTNHEYSLDYTTGKLVFGDAPTAAVTASYNYDVSSGSSAGLFVQMQTMLNNNTQYGGTFDALVGSSGSLTTMMTYNTNRISDLKTRLAAQQATLYTKYQNMQTILANLQSQGSYLTSLLASMNSSSSSSG